jgi:hypothetical protein
MSGSWSGTGAAQRSGPLWTLELAFAGNDKKCRDKLPDGLAGASAAAEREARDGAAMPHAGEQGHGVVGCYPSERERVHRRRPAIAC